MYIIVTEEQQRRQDEQARQMMNDWIRRAEEKAVARANHVERTTCPQCGRHDTPPPWLE